MCAYITVKVARTFFQLRMLSLLAISLAKHSLINFAVKFQTKGMSLLMFLGICIVHLCR